MRLCDTDQRAHIACSIESPDGIVGIFRHQQLAEVVDRKLARTAEAGLRARPVLVAAVAPAHLARESTHDSGGADLADGLVALVGDIDVADTVDRHRDRETELRDAGRAVGAAFDAGSGVGRNHAGGADPRDPVVAVIGHEQVAGSVERDARRRVEA